MKRVIRVLTVILVVLEAVLPCGKWGLQRIGYTLEPFSYVGYAWLLAVISAVVLFLRLFKKDESDGVLCVFLMPLSLLDALAYTSFFRTSSLHPQKSAWTVIALLICVLCSASITVVYGKPKIGRILVEIISVLLVLLIGLVGFVSCFRQEQSSRAFHRRRERGGRRSSTWIKVRSAERRLWRCMRTEGLIYCSLRSYLSQSACMRAAGRILLICSSLGKTKSISSLQSGRNILRGKNSRTSRSI